MLELTGMVVSRKPGVLLTLITEVVLHSPCTVVLFSWSGRGHPHRPGTIPTRVTWRCINPAEEVVFEPGQQLQQE